MIHRDIAHEDGKTFFLSSQDCEPVVEETKRRSNLGQHGGNEFKHAASIPLIIVEAYCNNNSITFHEFMNNQDHMKRLLNSPELKYFRVWKGRV